MKIYAQICHELNLTQFWPKVVSWKFDITPDDIMYALLRSQVEFFQHQRKSKTTIYALL